MDFDQFSARHGEASVQALIERMERYEGIRMPFGATLEQRWNVLIPERQSTEQRMAA